eukprot:2741339-Pleurochrysis_carterae.AAC.1
MDEGRVASSTLPQPLLGGDRDYGDVDDGGERGGRGENHKGGTEGSKSGDLGSGSSHTQCGWRMVTYPLLGVHSIIGAIERLFFARMAAANKLASPLLHTILCALAGVQRSPNDPIFQLHA